MARRHDEVSRESGQFIANGQVVAAAKIDLSRDLRRSMTEAEAILWDQVRSRRLGGLRFRRQQVIDGFIVDFYCAAARLVVEVDGPVHHDQLDYDRERDQVLAQRGLDTLRVSNDEVRQNLERILSRIAAIARERLR